jgi:hypothetical protein
VQLIVWAATGVRVLEPLGPRSMFTVRDKFDATRGQPGHDVPEARALELRVKYLEEYALAQQYCNRSLADEGEEEDVGELQ